METPLFLKTLYKYWMKFAYWLGLINGYIILTVFYVVIVGIYTIFYQAWAVVTGAKRKAKAEWKPKTLTNLDLESSSNQF